MFIWSNEKAEAELKAFTEKGLWHSSKWLAELLRKGAAVANIANIKELDRLNGDIVVANYHLLGEAEKSMIDNYGKGRVIIAEYPDLPECGNILTPSAPGWPRPLEFGEIPEAYIDECVGIIN